MSTQITEIEWLMTAALLAYAIAIFLGRQQRAWRLPRWVHFSCGFGGFGLDMYATYLMEGLRAKGWSSAGWEPLLIGHTIVSTLAIVLFTLVAVFGYRRQINVHRRLIYYGFIPVWLMSYGSGLFLIVVK